MEINPTLETPRFLLFMLLNTKILVPSSLKVQKNPPQNKVVAEYS